MTRPFIIVSPVFFREIYALYRVSHSLFWKARGSRPSPIIDRRGGFIILVPALIDIIVSDELSEGEDNY